MELGLGTVSTRALHCLPAMSRQGMGNFRGLVSCRNPLLRSFRDDFGLEVYMSIHRAFIKISFALALTSVTLLMTSASGQSPATRPNNTDKGIAPAQEPRLG
jgi:hypothetical protein